MSISTLLLVIATVVALWGCVFFALPAVARAKFIARLSELRDDADDAVIEKRLPDSEPVHLFMQKIDTFLAEPQMVSLSSMLAVHFTYEQQRGRLKLRPISYAGLTPAQRKLMHQLDDHLVAAMAEHIKFGSRFVLFFWCTSKVWHRSKMLSSGKSKIVPTLRGRRQLAKEFNRFTTPESGSRGLVSH